MHIGFHGWSCLPQYANDDADEKIIMMMMSLMNKIMMIMMSLMNKIMIMMSRPSWSALSSPNCRDLAIGAKQLYSGDNSCKM